MLTTCTRRLLMVGAPPIDGSAVQHARRCDVHALLLREAGPWDAGWPGAFRRSPGHRGGAGTRPPVPLAVSELDTRRCRGFWESEPDAHPCGGPSGRAESLWLGGASQDRALTCGRCRVHGRAWY